MRGSLKVLTQAVVGATVGAGVAAVPIIAIIQPGEKFFFHLLTMAGIDGSIGGAICGTIVGIISDKKTIAVVGGIAGAIYACVLLGVFLSGYWLFTSLPAPSPRAYPGVTVTRSGVAIGSWGIVDIQSYIVDQPIDILQTHYEKEMASHCVGEWQFKPVTNENQIASPNLLDLEALPDYLETSTCRQARCKIRRWQLAQEFSVLLCADSLTQTALIQEDAWQD